MKLLPQQIAPPHGVGNFSGGVLPDLSQQEAVRRSFLHGGADLRNEIVRQFIRHVQPPAGSSGPQPVPHHGILSPDDEIPVIRRIFPDGRQRPDPPPRVIVCGPRMKAVPMIIGGVGTLGSAGIRIEAVGVEIAALGAGVVEYAVQNHPDTAALRLLTEMVKIVLRAKHGVNGTVIGSVVAVVGGRFKNGVQIQHCDAEIRQIVQFGEDTLQRTAEKVAVPHFTLCVRPPVREI